MNEEQLEYLKQIADGNTNDDIARLMMDRFKIEFSTYQVAKYKARYSVKSGPSRKPRKRVLTDEEFEWLKARCHGKHYSELALMLKEEFGKEVTAYQLSNFFRKRKVSTGITGKIEKGSVGLNKGKKLSPLQYEKRTSTMFKKGQQANVKLSVGDERMRGDGYLWIKVEEPNKWKQKHIALWEQEYGSVPKGMCVSFLDGDRTNCTIENLVLMSRGERAIMTRMKLGSKDPDLAKVGFMVSKILNLKHQKTKGEKV